MTDSELLEAFEACTLPPEHFKHREHVRVAWLMLREHELLAAIARFRAGLQRYAASLGASGKYHETVTWAFMILIHEACTSRPAATWDEFARAHPDLLASSLLGAYYSPELLASERARRSFVLPDRVVTQACPPAGDPRRGAARGGRGSRTTSRPHRRAGALRSPG
jgi:nitroreductase